MITITWRILWMPVSAAFPETCAGTPQVAARSASAPNTPARERQRPTTFTAQQFARDALRVRPPRDQHERGCERGDRRVHRSVRSSFESNHESPPAPRGEGFAVTADRQVRSARILALL